MHVLFDDAVLTTEIILHGMSEQYQEIWIEIEISGCSLFLFDLYYPDILLEVHRTTSVCMGTSTGAEKIRQIALLDSGRVL
jgi:hypothetical protein